MFSRWAEQFLDCWQRNVNKNKTIKCGPGKHCSVESFVSVSMVTKALQPDESVVWVQTARWIEVSELTVTW